MKRWWSLSTRCPRLWVALAWLSCTGASTAGAQALADAGAGPADAAVSAATSAAPEATTEAEPPGYRAAIEEAVHEFSRRNFEEARAMFARAHAISPNARTERGLGMTEFELKNYGPCVTHLEAALASQVRRLDDTLRADTERMLEHANTFVARYVVDARPSITSLKLDGFPVQVANGDVLLVKVGDHTVELFADGYQPERRKLSVRTGGEVQRLTVLFTKPLQHTAKSGPSARRDWYKSPWLWTAVGVVVAGAATGTALAVAGHETETASAKGGSTNVVLGSP